MDLFMLQNAYLAPTGLPAGALIFFTVLMIIIALWTIVWKALALWHAARSRQRLWFIALLVINTAGILEIIYMVWFRKDKNEGQPGHLFPEMVRKHVPESVTSLPDRVRPKETKEESAS